MGIAVPHLGAHADIGQQFDDTAFTFSRCTDTMYIQRFTNNLCYCPARAQRRERILKNYLHAASLLTELIATQPEDILTIDEDLTGRRLVKT